jgi:hypothetical protein
MTTGIGKVTVKPELSVPQASCLFIRRKVQICPHIEKKILHTSQGWAVFTPWEKAVANSGMDKKALVQLLHSRSKHIFVKVNCVVSQKRIYAREKIKQEKTVDH